MEVVSLLNTMYIKFDQLSVQYRVYKVRLSRQCMNHQNYPVATKYQVTTEFRVPFYSDRLHGRGNHTIYVTLLHQNVIILYNALKNHTAYTVKPATKKLTYKKLQPCT